MEARVSSPHHVRNRTPVAAEDHILLLAAGFHQRDGEAPGRYRRIEGVDYLYITRYVHTTSRQMWWAYRHSRSSSSWQGEILPTAAAALAFAEVENWGRK